VNYTSLNENNNAILHLGGLQPYFQILGKAAKSLPIENTLAYFYEASLTMKLSFLGNIFMNNAI
jgi:hypothetical protein